MPLEKSKNKKNYIISYILVAVLGFLVGLALYLWQLDFYHARGESPPNFLTSFFGENKAQNTRIGSISESQIMQRLVDAASERLTAIKAYESIPKNQLDNLSYEDFDQYINRLKRVYKNSPISFTPMNHKEKQLTLLSISKTSPDLAEQATQAAFFWLEPDSVYGDNVKLPILLQKQSDGTAYISSLWVKNCLEIYSYSELYFSAIDRADVKMLSALLSSASDKEEIRLKKAEQTIQYYKDEIQGNFNDYDIVSWRIDGMVLRQNLINASENNSAFSNIASAFQDLAASQSKRAANARFVYVLAVEPHVWQLRDVIPQSYVANDFSFVLPNAASIAPGDIVDKDYLHELFGELLALQDNRKTETTPSDKAVTQLISEGAGKIVALYNGAHIILDDPLIDPGSGYFSGKINTITILSADGKQGSGLKIGDGVEQILQNYPFLDLNSYTGIDERKALYFMLMVRGGKVMAMRSGILPEGGDSTLQLFNRDLNSSVGGLPTPAPTLTPTPIPSPTPKPSPKPSAKASSKPAPSPSPKP